VFLLLHRHMPVDLLLLALLPLSRGRPELMEACAAWARGQRFADVLNLAPDVFEGSLVRAVRRV
jgi:superfamily II RNA helicase